MSVPVPISRVFFVTAKENVSTGSGSIARIVSIKSLLLYFLVPFIIYLLWNKNLK